MEDLDAMRGSSGKRFQAKSARSEQLGRARVAANLAGTTEVIPTVSVAADKGKKVTGSKSAGKRTRSSSGSGPPKKLRIEETAVVTVFDEGVQRDVHSVTSPAKGTPSPSSSATPRQAEQEPGHAARGVEIGKAAVLEICNDDLGTVYDGYSPSHLAGIVGGNLISAATAIRSYTNRLAAANKERKSLRIQVADLEKRISEGANKADLDAARVRISELEGELEKSKSDVKLSQDLAAEKVEAVNKLSEEVARLRGELAGVKTELSTSRGETFNAQGELTKTKLNLEGKISDLERQLAAAKKSSSSVTAISEYKKTQSYRNELFSYYEKGKAQILRVAAACGVSLRDLIKWGSAEHRGDLARHGHELVPYRSEELELISRKDAEQGRDAWAPPSPFSNNVSYLLDALDDGDTVEFDGDFKLNEFEGTKSNQEAHAKAVYEAESRADP